VSLAGFGNHHSSEAVPGALPSKQNSPQKCPFELYAEQLSGSAFTRARHQNLHSWLYRKLPSVVQGDYRPYSTNPQSDFLSAQAPNPWRWSPLKPINHAQDFIDGLFHFAGSQGLQTYIYQCNQSMQARYFSSLDGELLFIPYEGSIRLKTELGALEISPGHIAVIPRGIKFKVELLDSYAGGYLCENAAAPLKLPDHGLIGANSLAHPRHFIYPTAAFEDVQGEVALICKSGDAWWQATSQHSPLNVVAWHGNYAPYSYDLSLFNTINTVSFDHPDPSIFTVLTAESEVPGVAHLDFVIFPSRWMVAEHSFRPPYFHRNIMNEWMGLIIGKYDAKKEGFAIGGVSIHNCMTAHGPDSETYAKASQQQLKPAYYANTLAFMLETKNPWKVTKMAMEHPSRQKDYTACWQGLK
jgi:homogentisate 1,2-dioxygenase